MRIFIGLLVGGLLLMIAVGLFVLLARLPWQDAILLALVACAVVGIGSSIIAFLIAMVLTLRQENLSTRCNQIAAFFWPGDIFFWVAYFRLGQHHPPEAWRPHVLHAGIACFAIAFIASITAATTSTPHGQSTGESPFREGES